MFTFRVFLFFCFGLWARDQHLTNAGGAPCHFPQVVRCMPYHFISKDATQFVLMQKQQPLQTNELIGFQLEPERQPRTDWEKELDLWFSWKHTPISPNASFFGNKNAKLLPCYCYQWNCHRLYHDLLKKGTWHWRRQYSDGWNVFCWPPILCKKYLQQFCKHLIA